MKNYIKITNDLFWTQMKWTYGFLGVMFFINIVKIAFNFFRGTEVDGGFYYSILIAANIFMLIIGFIAVYFLPYYVENGVTRKDAYLGTLFASIGVATSIPIIAFLISIVERFILTTFLGLSYKVQDMNEVVLDLDGNIIGDLVISVIMAPYIDPSNSWILALTIFALNLFIIYILGWFISTGFYVGGIITGLVFILVSFILNILKDTFLRVTFDLPLSDRLDMFASLPMGITIPGIFVLILFTVWLIRLMTRRVPIKM